MLKGGKKITHTHTHSCPLKENGDMLTLLWSKLNNFWVPKSLTIKSTIDQRPYWLQKQWINKSFVCYVYYIQYS